MRLPSPTTGIALAIAALAGAGCRTDGTTAAGTTAAGTTAPGTTAGGTTADGTHAAAPSRLGQESPPDGEAAAEAATIDIIRDLLVKQHPAGSLMVRDAHPKHHGCVRASFEVAPSLPPALAHGVLKPGARYDAWVRFSNSSRTIQPDAKGDGRGLAMKLLGVPGEKLLASERQATTQDFLLINHPVFFIKDAIEYRDFVAADAVDRPVEHFIGIKNPLDWHIRGLQIAGAILGKSITSPLEIEYHSMTPYRLGPEHQAVKYKMKPCAATRSPIPSPPPDDYLRFALADALGEDQACFDFYLQVQTDADRMPIEDATVEWSPAESPFVRAGKLTIPAQSFESPAQMAFCENLSFTPWHALPEHRPLGSLNRIRRAVYVAISTLRHTHNGAPRVEPTDLTVPPLTVPPLTLAPAP